MKNKTTRKLVVTAMIAAVYVVVTLAFGFMSYGSIQFRISEVMVLLAFIDPLYLPGLVLGCFIANLFGPFGVIDAIIGTFATFVTVYMIIKMKKRIKNETKSLFIASLMPSIFSFIIAIGIYYVSIAETAQTSTWVFWSAYGTIALGEFVVVTLLGFPMFKYILSKPEWVKRLTI